MEYIKINNLTLKYQNEKLFEATNLSVQEGQKIGLIGENGVGKTTLFKIIKQEPIVFEVTGQITRNCKIIMVPQILENNEQSGGEREKRTIALAANQLRNNKNAVLLLDEPTSNLDIEQQNWLTALLRDLPNPLIVISHDRNFLEKTVNTIWLLRNQEISEYKSSFTQFQLMLKSQEQSKMAAYEIQKRKIKKLQEAQRRKKQKGNHANKPKRGQSWSERKTRDYGGKERRLLRASRIMHKRIDEETAKLVKPKVSKPILFKNVKNKNLELAKSSSLFRIESQDVFISQKKLFNISREIKVKNGEKIALTGPNGSGKSIFLNQLFEHQLNVWINPKVKIGFFKQNMTNEAENTATLQDEIRRSTIFDNKATMQLLGDLHLRQFLNNQVCDLSGGQLICFKLAKVLLGEHNLLLLDEPNNFLDLSSIKAMEEFLSNYPFSVIVVSHDQGFLKNLQFTSWKIREHKLDLPSDFSSAPNSEKANQLNLLKFKLDQLISDSEVAIAEICAIKQEIADLEKREPNI